MGDLVVQLIPLALGVVLSPLVIMALVAVLVSERARTNGTAFLIGWAVAVAVTLVAGVWICRALELHEVAHPPLWSEVLRILAGLLLLYGAVWAYRKGHAHVTAMAAATSPQQVVDAAPQMPGWLKSVSKFRPGRSALLGFGIFVLNPVDLSCTLIAALDLTLADVSDSVAVVVAIVFWVVVTVPIAAPVVYVLVRGAAAQPSLDRLRDWVSSHSNILNAAMLLVIAVLQLQKGLTGLL